jgi:hypothetical protein
MPVTASCIGMLVGGSENGSQMPVWKWPVRTQVNGFGESSAGPDDLLVADWFEHWPGFGSLLSQLDSKL